MNTTTELVDTVDNKHLLKVLTALKKGDFSIRMPSDRTGIAGKIVDTLNDIIEMNQQVAECITNVSRVVGRDGHLAHRASVPNAVGGWATTIKSVNTLIDDLVRPTTDMARVIGAVAKGDLSQTMALDVDGRPLKGQFLRAASTANTMVDQLSSFASEVMRVARDAGTEGKLGGQAQVEGAAGTWKDLADHVNLMAANLTAQVRGIAGAVSAVGVEGNSGLGAAPPTNIVVLPTLFEQQVKAVMEIASLDRFTETHLSSLDQLMESIGAVLNTIEANSRTESLLTQSQSLAHELQQMNQELAERARLLSEQNIEVERKNSEVEQAKLALEDKAAQLALSLKYKSEFLANMSHELRTPLNSLLILAEQLSDNPDGNLTNNQVEFAKTIHGSGSDLLTLINDILDLSKIESGTVTLEVGEYQFQNLRHYVERTFRHMAEAKRISFSVELADDLPVAMMTDTTRLQQILKNLLSNAFKFTAHGQVSLRIGLADSGWTIDHPNLCQADAVLAFSVTDTGAGIAGDKLQLIFEAFQQADGGTARKYGGTGLGLSISRELARLLNGEIRVESEINAGSTFTLFLPYKRSGFVNYDLTHQWYSPTPIPTAKVIYSDDEFSAHPENAEPCALHPATEAAQSDMPGEATFDDRALIAAGDPVVLIVQDNPRFAKTLLDFAREKNFKGIVTIHGDSALTLARDYLPAAIFLDMDLPDIDGFTVLDRLKLDPGTRHIPVHVLSNQKERKRSLRHGAISYLNKPIGTDRLEEEFIRIQQFLTHAKRSLLVVEDDPMQRHAILELIGDKDVDIVTAETAQQALEALAATHFDCMVLDLTLPDICGFKLLDIIGKDPRLCDLPVVIYTARELNPKETAKLRRIAKTIVIKEARSPERLLHETALFLHRSHASLPEQQRRMLNEIHAADNGLAGRQVLIVDDDLRNIFALSSVLERQQMNVLFSENGKDGIEMLENNPSIEIVLMDIMMPEMDGYDTMRAIRRIPKFKSLPIITLTAKAMKGDRDKCISAGASDYITKPVDVAQLLSLMRVWLHK